MAILDQLRTEIISQAFQQFGLDRIDFDQVYRTIEQNYDDPEPAKQQFDQQVERLAVELVAALSDAHVRQALVGPGEWDLALERPLGSYDTDSLDEWLRWHLVDRIFDE